MRVLMMDIDGVIVQGRPADGLHCFASLEQDLGIASSVLQRAFFEPYWEDVVTGREALAPRLEMALREMRSPVAAQTLIDYWFANDSRIRPDILDSLAHYRNRGIRVFLATNQEHLRAQYLMEVVGLADHVDGMIYSAALGCRKPFPAFYEKATGIVGESVASIVFVDDRLENVVAARDHGWAAVHWTGETTLPDALSAFHAGAAARTDGSAVGR